MAKVPPDHLLHLQKRPFTFGCATAVFPPEELQALADYGNWMEALVAGVIQPVTAEQKRFLRVHREEVEPSTVRERAWQRLLGRREYEREQNLAPPPEPPNDYGMVEWDADRCWW